ncbi:NDUFB9, NADH-ubiquinone oxidoreductase [Auriscalpium vulgare]|uniref:NDUFB9, NADH-ubiquinone oxidoreductase n=1 Tax=Auriscalpium vulgare TaxID=40419 RepID=A0ACB8RSU5_9AGAM|nr:NDUFB9, NADH-ubiquinone oxidoreductase [Auriscalpium vulgare]
MSASPFSAAHRLYVKSLYKRMLKNELDWVIRYDLFRPRALAIRAQFEANRDVHDPRALAAILEKAEADLAQRQHPDPYIPSLFPGGTKWERNAPPPLGPIFDHEAHDAHH